MHTLFEDLRCGARVLRSRPGLTVTAVITLALGIAANTTVFDWVDGVLLNPIPGAARGSELAMLETLNPSGELANTAYRDYRDYRDRSQLVSGMAASLSNVFTVGNEQNPRLLWGEFVSANYFAVLGIRPVRGRAFLPGEWGDASGGPPVVVISHRVWQSIFQGGDAIGKTLRVNQRQLTVVGVMPAEFRGVVPGLVLEMWIPMALAPEMNGQGSWLLENRNARQMWVTARLRPGVTVEQAQAEAAASARRIAEEHPDSNRAFGATVLPIWRGHSGAQEPLRMPLQILMVVSLLMFLIVGANVANLQLARSAVREKEFSIRLALGARPYQLVRQLLTESLLLAALGAAGGALLSMWGRWAPVWLLPPTNLPVDLGSTQNWHILICVIVLCVAAGILTGVAPALQSLRTSVNEHLKESSRGGSSGSGVRRTQSLLVIAEVALATVAMVGTGVAARTFFADRNIDSGMKARNVAAAKYYVETFCRTDEERSQFYVKLAERLRAIPGVAAASYSTFIPLEFGDSGDNRIAVDGYAPAGDESMRVGDNDISPGYFDTLGIPLLEGRDFRDQDDQGTAPVMIVNQAFAQHYFRGGPAVGRKVRVGKTQFTVVGMVRDSKYRRLTEGPTPHFYTASRQYAGGEFWIAFFVRTNGPVASAVPVLAREAAAVNPATRGSSWVPFEDLIGAALYPQRVAATLVGGVGAISLILAAIGLYSVLAFAVSQRTRELGIRIALGARPRHVLATVLRQGMGLTLLGLAVGALAAQTVLKFSAAYVPGMRSDDLTVLASSLALLGAVGFLASYLPARRAMLIDPVLALRQE